eukprot:657990-Pyramimonas_sp.AAC.1
MFSIPPSSHILAVATGERGGSEASPALEGTSLTIEYTMRNSKYSSQRYHNGTADTLSTSERNRSRNRLVTPRRLVTSGHVW